MVDTLTMSKLLQAPTKGYGDAIVIPAILAENFELKVGLLSLVTSSQFHGFERDDPHSHIPRTWLEKEPPRSIHTWEDIVSKFVNYFFPPSKTTNLKNDITNFQQRFDEMFNEAWDHFKDLLHAPRDGLNRTPRDALTIIKNKSKVRTSRNKPIVSKVNTTTSSPSLSSDVTALTEIVKELLLMNKATQQSNIKAIEENCEVKREPEVTRDKVQTTSLESTAHVQPSVVRVPIPEPDVAPKPNPKPSIPYPSRHNDQKLREKANNQMLKFLKILQRLHFDISFADALLHMPKFASTFKGLLRDFILEEIETFLRTPNELSNLDDDYYDTEGDILYLEKLLNEDPSLNLFSMMNKGLKQADITMMKPSIEEPSKLKLKDLPSHLEYAFLEGTDKLPVIISKELKDEEKAALLKVLKSHKQAIAWKISDIKGIDPCFCTHKILIEDDFKLAVQHQRMVNSKIHEVIKKEVIKLLDAGLIYPISDSLWVTPGSIVYLFKISKIGRPMTHLLKKDTLFIFSKECIEAFNTLKKKLTEAPVLVALDWDLPFEIMCNASDFAIDAKPRLLRWILLLQEFDVVICDKKGAESLAADHLSRLENPHQGDLEKKEINETFPLKTLEMISSRSDSSTPIDICDHKLVPVSQAENLPFIPSKICAASEWFTKECIDTISTWDYLVERFVLKFYNLCDHEETEDNNDPDVIENVPEIFKINDDLFKFDSPLCIKTYDEYEQKLNNKTQGLVEPWSDNGVPYQLCDHVCEPYRFKNGRAKWHTCTSDIDGFCNGGELSGMVRVGCMTYFQCHEWYDELADGKFKDEILAVKAIIEGSWGDATPGKVNTHEIAPFTRRENFGRGPYANIKTEWANNPYLDVNYIFGRDYEASNIGCTQENHEHKGNPIREPLNCRVRRFEMMKYSFTDNEEYITVKESNYLNHSKDSLGDYDLWSKYLTHTDYALWEVIMNGDAPASTAPVSGGAEAAIPPKTTKQKIARRNESKAKSTLLFGGNKESKKMQKTILKQQYENFAASRAEGLDKTYDSLPPAWNTHTLIMRNKYDLDTLSMYDLYNNLKVYEAEINSQSSSGSNSQNVAFVSSDNNSSTNEAVNTAHDLDNEDFEQIDTGDLEEMDLKWQVTLLENARHQRVRGIEMETIQEGLYQWRLMLMPWLLLMGWVMIGAIKLQKDPTDFALMAFSSSGSSSSDTERKILNKANLEIIVYQLGLESLEARTVVHQKNEAVFKEDIAFLKDLNNKSDVFESASDSSVNESEEENNQANDRYKADSSVFKSAISETVTSVHETKTSASKTSKESMEKPKNVRRNFVTIVVITNSGKVPVNTAKQSSPRAAASTSTARYVNIATTRPTVNGAKSSLNVFHKSHSSVRRTFNQRTTPKNSDLKETINTAKRPTGNVIDHISKDSGSYMLKRFNNGNPQYTLQDQEIFDSGCSRHMTGNKSFLTDYQDIDGGFFAFGGSPK
nr:reverse transcriptase domain-containing protein [Tanacetum cinerariifolium]